MKSNNFGVSIKSDMFMYNILWAILSRALGCMLLALILGKLSVTPALTQTTTIACVGAPNPTSVSQVNVDLAAQTCTITDGISSTAPSTGSMRFIAWPDNDPDGIFVQVRRPGNDNDLLTAFTQCDMPGGTTTAGRCRHEGNPVASGTGTYTNTLGTTQVSLTVTYTATLNSITIVTASVTFGTPVPTTGLTAQDRSKITDSLVTSFLIADGSIFEPNVLPSFVYGGSRVNGSGVSFTPTRLTNNASLAPNDPLDSPSGFDQFGRQETTFGDTTTNSGFNFSFDLNAMMCARADAAAARAVSLGGYKSGLKDTTPWSVPRLNAWASGRYVDFDDGQINADRSGDLWWITSGLSYRVNERATLGAFGRFKQGEVSSTALQSTLDSNFYGGGAFATLTVLGGARVMLGGLFEHGDNDIVIQSARSSFDTDQWTLEGRLDKRFTRGRHWVEPQVNIRYTAVDREGFTDSAGNVIASSDLNLGRLTYGPNFGTTITKPNGTEIRPFARINGIWDFENEGDFTLSTAAVFLSADAGLNLGSGVEVNFASGMALRLSGDWYTYDTALNAWSVQGGISAPLAALGLASAAYTGRVSFDLTTSADNQTAKTRIALPLN